MISIAKDLDEYDIAQQIRLERKNHKGSFLLLEGDTDVKRFENFTAEQSCSLINCYGKLNAINAIILLYDEGFLGALGAVDADFDRLTGKLLQHEGLTYSEAHDFDLDWVKPSVVQRYLAKVGDITKCTTHGSASDIITKIMSGLKFVSVARLLNELGKIRYKLSKIDISRCFESFTIDPDRYISLIFEDRAVTDTQKIDLKDKIGTAFRRDYPLLQITNGHDFHCALGMCLRGDLASRLHPQTWGREVEIHLRLAFGDEDFKNSIIYRDIRYWETENPPFRVLDQRFMERKHPSAAISAVSDAPD